MKMIMVKRIVFFIFCTTCIHFLLPPVEILKTLSVNFLTSNYQLSQFYSFKTLIVSCFIIYQYVFLRDSLGYHIFTIFKICSRTWTMAGAHKIEKQDTFTLAVANNNVVKKELKYKTLNIYFNSNTFQSPNLKMHQYITKEL